jgi:hypothetical protein
MSFYLQIDVTIKKEKYFKSTYSIYGRRFAFAEFSPELPFRRE